MIRGDIDDQKSYLVVFRDRLAQQKVAILLLLLFPPTPISYIVCMANNGNTDGGFHVFATRVAYWVGTKRAFLLAMLSIVLWLLSGPYFHYSDTWQLIINTGTTVITFLVVFLIQNTQNRDARAIHEHSRIIQLCNSQLHPITKRFHGHAICRLEWASSFRACRDAGPAPGSCSDQDDTVSAALPKPVNEGSSVTFFPFFSHDEDHDSDLTEGVRETQSTSRRNEWSTYGTTSVFHRSTSFPVRSDGRGNSVRRNGKGI